MSVFEEIGLIRGYSVMDDNEGKLEVFLKYSKSQCIIQHLKQISTPGRRIYASLLDLVKLKERGSKNIYIISTSKGLMLDSECMRLRICGEVLLKVVL